MLACTDLVFRTRDQTNRFSQYDLGQACISLCLQATPLGLMTHQMGGIDADKARKELNIPDRFTPMTAIALGYLCDPNTLSKGLKDTELDIRSRQPMSENFFSETWGNVFLK